MVTDELHSDGSAAARDVGCARCEQADGLDLFTERRSPVVGTRGVLRFLLAVVLVVVGIELVLVGGSPAVAAVPLALAVPAALACRAAVRRARTERVTVLHCPHCSARTEV